MASDNTPSVAVDGKRGKNIYVDAKLTNFEMSSAITFTVFNQIVTLAARYQEQPWVARIKSEV